MEKRYEKTIIYSLNIQLFAATQPGYNMNKSTDESMAPNIKDFYDTMLLENAREAHVWNRFGTHQIMTHGKTAEWRKFNTFAPALTPLTEGVIPDGSKFGMVTITASLTQHGDYTAITDVVELTDFDDTLTGAAEEMGSAMGETQELLTRNIVCAGNSVAYCPNADGNMPESRAALDGTSRLTPKMINRAATWLKKNKVQKINGKYVAIIHPSVAEDLRSTDEWKEFHLHNDVKPIFDGEIGELHGIRFVESNSAPVYAQESGSVYATVFFGKGAYGILDLEGGEARLIIKSKEEVGGPIEQFGTVGYKFMHGAKILYPERLLRMESNSSYNDEAN